jgi:hypothetical protein
VGDFSSGKKALVLGAGYVSAPVIEYLTRDPDLGVTVAAAIKVTTREMENNSRGPTFGDFVTIRTEASSCKTTEYKSNRFLFPPSSKCYLLRESLSVDSQNIPCATLKRRGWWVISVKLWYPQSTQSTKVSLQSSELGLPHPTTQWGRCNLPAPPLSTAGSCFNV